MKHSSEFSIRAVSPWICGWVLLALLGAGRSQTRAAENITLGTLVPEGTSYHRSLQEMAASWRKAPDGGVRLRIYAGGKLGGEAKMVSQMRLGALDAGLLTAVGLSEIEKSVAGLQFMPMMFQSLDEVDYVGQRLQPMLAKRLEAQGFVVLFWTDAGWIRYFSKSRIVEPDDMRPKKLFIWAGEATAVEIWKNAGFNPVPLETANIIPMLDTGLIDVVPMPPFVALASQVHERAPHMLELNWAPLIGALVMRKATWDKMPPATRAELLKAAEAAGKQNKAHGRAESEKAVQVMKEKGLKVHQVSPSVEAKWRGIAEPTYPQIRGDIVPADVFDEVQRLLQQYRRERSASAK